MRRIHEFELGQESVVVGRIIRALEARYSPTLDHDTALMPTMSSEEKTEHHEVGEVVDLVESTTDLTLQSTPELREDRKTNIKLVSEQPSQHQPITPPNFFEISPQGQLLCSIIGIAIGILLWFLLDAYLM